MYKLYYYVCMHECMYTTAVWLGLMEIDGGVVCVYSTYNSISHDSACLGRQKDVVVIN